MTEGFGELLDFLVCNHSVSGLQPWEIQNLQGEIYQRIRHKLIRLFRWRGSDDPDDLADETFDRVRRRLPDRSSYVGDPAHYVCGVARLVFLESLRQRRLPVPPPRPEKDEHDEKALDCLDECLNCLSRVERDLILEYYRGEKRAKIDHREKLARSLGTSANALRIQTCRLRGQLRKCVSECMERK
jgi:DNA-directed RNA polymerase specialized sigma24 family protein